MRFLVDSQLPPALARWIADEGHQAMHVANLGLAGASDGEIWHKAIELASVIVSKDEDFIQRSRTGGGPQIVRVTSGNTSKRHLLDMMEKIFP